MNCECVYVIKNATEETYDSFAEMIQDFDKYGELYPVTYAEIIRDVKCTKNYYGDGRKSILKAGTKVIFVAGKAHNMKDYGKAKVLFPRERADYKVWFKDLKEY